MNKPRISVLIDTYNHERFIVEAVQSVLSQDFPAAAREVLVVDDGSTDQTHPTHLQFGEQIRVLRKPNGGQASAFNTGIPECRGEIVAFLDGDDYWLPGKLTAVANAFRDNPDVGLVGHGITELLQDGTQRSELLKAEPKFRLDSLQGAQLFRFRRSFLGTSRMAYRAAILQRIGKVPDSLTVQADEYLFTLAGLFADVLVLRESLTVYRLHGQNMFQVSAGNQAGLRRKHDVLAALASELDARFQLESVDPAIRRAIVDSIQAEADFLRLFLEPCKPWETIRIEMKNFQLLRADSSPAAWFKKCLTLFPALFCSSQTYLSWKNRFAASTFYRNFRAAPADSFPHVDRENYGSGH